MTVYKNLCVLGIGLVGSSILRRARHKDGIAAHIAAYDINANVLNRARALGLADSYHDSPETAVAEADCVIICAPVCAIADIARRTMPHLKSGATLSDVGSTRRTVFEAIMPYLRQDIPYIAAHPMAGTEFSGPDAGFATLFENRWCLVTPTENATKQAEEKLLEFWHGMGAKTRIMDAAEHDRVCAIVSHLPHLIAFTICDTADKMSETYRTAVLDYAASGFRDFTRIAASDPVMWRDIFLSNKEALLETLGRFQNDIAELASAIRNDESDRITDAIEKGRRIRRKLIDNETV